MGGEVHMKLDDTTYLSELEAETRYSRNEVVELISVKHGEVPLSRVDHAVRLFFRDNMMGVQPDGYLETEEGYKVPTWFGKTWKRQVIRSSRMFDQFTDPRISGEDVSNSDHAEGFVKVNFKDRFSIKLPKAVSAAAFCVGILTVSAALQRFIPDEGFAILKEEGPVAAETYIRQNYDDSVDVQYALAWSYLTKGEYDLCDEITDRLFVREDLSYKKKADCFFLRAILRERTGNAMLSLANYNKAIEIYQELGLESNIFKSMLGMVQWYLNLQKYKEASQLLDQAYNLSEQWGYPLGFYYSLNHRLSFKMDNYEQALEYAFLAHQEYTEQQDSGGMANALSSISFYQMLIGDWQSGYDNAVTAEKALLETGHDEGYIFNLVNFVLYNKCHERSVSALTDSVTARIIAVNDPALKEFLEFALGYCDSTARIGGNNRPTPPD
jgi:tetratricopeptide (TPR) repeat protein